MCAPRAIDGVGAVEGRALRPLPRRIAVAHPARAIADHRATRALRGVRLAHRARAYVTSAILCAGARHAARRAEPAAVARTLARLETVAVTRARLRCGAIFKIIRVRLTAASRIPSEIVQILHAGP